MSTPIREHIQHYLGMHKMVVEELPYDISLEAKAGLANAILATILIQADKSKVEIDFGELDGLKMYTPEPERVGVVHDGAELEARREARLNPYAIVEAKIRERLEKRGPGLSSKQYAVLCDLITEARGMTDSQHAKLRPSDVLGFVRDVSRDRLRAFVLSEGVV